MLHEHTQPQSPTAVASSLNDQGAKLFESGNYEDAIEVLVKALKLWEQVETGQACQCKACPLDECIRASMPATAATMQHSSLLSKGIIDVEIDDYEEGDERFIFRRPIFTPNSFQMNGHSPGVTLSLIIILNLAMAHHMSAIEHDHCRKRLQKALQLYELAHQLQLEEEVCSPRATIIIANNVGEIHRAVKNYNKHTMCLQHLLSTMMYMIDCRVPVSSIELEGFFRNTSQLILHSNCASAA